MFSPTHQLAVIMFTDIVGYTAMMGADEPSAMNIVKVNRNIHKRTIKKHNGKWLKEMGDGTLASFKTINDAVFAAGEILSACKDQNIELRIGIHFGEITAEGGDIFGNGVNIASRIESIANPGQIVVSEPVHQNVKNKPGIHTTFLRVSELKNVDEPVKVYSLSVDSDYQFPDKKKINYSHALRLFYLFLAVSLILLIGYSLSTYFQINNQSKSLIVEKSVAVLPFTLLSENEDEQHLSRGVKEAIEDQLSTIKELRISSQSSTTPYQDTNKPNHLIAEELNVRYILTGSVHKYNDVFRITAKIFDVNTDENIWSKQFTEPKDKFFLIMDNVAENIKAQLAVKILPYEKEQMTEYPTNSYEAYELYMRGRMHFGNYMSLFDQEDLYSAEKYFKQALSIDSTFALAYVGLGEVHNEKREKFGTLSIHAPEYTDSIMIFASKALEFDPNLANAYALRGQYYVHTDQISKAIKDQELAISIRPNLSKSYYNLGIIWFTINNNPVEGFKYMMMAREYEKDGMLLPNIIYDIGAIYATVGDYKNAEIMTIKQNQLRLEPDPFPGPIIWLFIEQGKFDKAIALLDSYNTDQYKGMIDLDYFYSMIYTFTSRFDLALPLLEKLGEIELALQKEEESTPGNHLLAYVYLKSGRIEKGMKIFNDLIDYSQNYGTITNLYEIYAEMGEYEQSLEELLKLEEINPYRGIFEFVQHCQVFEPLHNNPEFISMIDRVKNIKAEARHQINILESETIIID